MTFHIWHNIFLKLIWEKGLCLQQSLMIAPDSLRTTLQFYALGKREPSRC